MKYSKLLVLGVVIAGSIFSCSMFKGKDKDSQETEVELIVDDLLEAEEDEYLVEKLIFTGDYKALWEEVLKLEQKGLFESSLKIVDQIYDMAFKENNANQVVKSSIYRLKYNQYLKEDDYVIAIDNMNTLVETTKTPTKQLIHSITAQIYWTYYSNNRWKFNKRTNTTNFVQKDIRTWSLEKIVEHVHYHYSQSLKRSKKTKSIAISSFDEILIKGKNTIELRPTLYDFLAHRALDFYKNTEPDVTKPSYAFELNQRELFSSSEVFINSKLNTRDTTSGKYLAYIILKNLTDFHLNRSKNTAALVDVELERLFFAKSNSILQEKDELYYKALLKLSNKYANHEAYTEISYHIAQYRNQRASKYDPHLKDKNDKQNLLYKWDSREAISICRKAVAKFPDSYGASYCRNLIKSIQSKSISFQSEQVAVPNEPSKGLITTRNLNKVYLKLIIVDFDVEKEKRFKNQQERIDYYNEKEVFKTWDINLVDDKSYRSKSFDFVLPKLTEGYYLLLASSKSDFSYRTSAVGYSFLWSSNISYVQRRTKKAENEFTVLNRKTGFPIKGVKAKAYYEKYNYTKREYSRRHLGTYYTNENGYFKIPSSSSDYRSIYLDFSKDNDRLNTNRTFYQNKYYPSKEKARTNSYLFIDRGIYRPGQTVYFKGLLSEQYKNQGKVLANRKVSVTFFDANYQKIESKDLRTNEYGTISGEFVTPNGLINGQMSIVMNVSGKSTVRKYFRVEEYKRPKFEVSFNPIKGSFKLEQNIKVQGLAKAYAGNNIDGAKVKYRVTRNASFPWWCWYYYGFRPSSASMEITSGETATDENGNFDVIFKAIADKSVNKRYQPTYSYQVSADVTDINGETHSSMQYVYVGYKALNVNVSIPNQLNVNAKGKFAISSTNLNGEKVASNGTISIFKFKEASKLMRSRKLGRPTDFIMSKSEHDNLFPYDLYDNESEESELERILIKKYNYTAPEDKESHLEIANLKSYKPGKYQLEINTVDEFGTSVKEIKSFMVYDDKSTICPVNEFSWIKAMKSYGEPGDVAVYLLASKAKNVKVLYEIEHKGKIVTRKWITLNDEQKRIEIPIEEKHRGNFGVHFVFEKENRVYAQNFTVSVPHTNKQLDITFETFRNKLLPGQKETWKVNIKGKKGDKVMAEMLGTMYDASLDAFAANSFYLNIYNSYYSSLGWNTLGGFGTARGNIVSYNWNPTGEKLKYRSYDRLNQFGIHLGGNNYYGYGRGARAGSVYFSDDAEMESSDMVMEEMVVEADKSAKKPRRHKYKKASELAEGNTGKDKELLNFKADKLEQTTSTANLGSIKARTNFNETAFFFPHLTTNSNGDISFSFEMPESLTRWKFMGLAHTKDMRVGSIQKEIITQKDLMVVPNVPRFLREGDQITISTKISNISEKDLHGHAQLFLFDAFTMKPIDTILGNIPQEKVKLYSGGHVKDYEEHYKYLNEGSGGKKRFYAKSKQSTSVSWDIKIPFGVQSVTYKIVAQAGNFTDGEEDALPVLTNRMLVTEALPLPTKKKGTKLFTFDKLLNSNGSTTLKHHKLTLEYTSNPAWYVVQAMPYMMEYPYDCAEQTFTRFYANSLATHIMNGNPKIKQIVEAWKDNSPEEFLSNLEKNEELKSLLLQETPWVMQAKNESARKRRIAELFNLNKMTRELDRAMKKLQKLQVSNGGWPWFKGMRESRYITQHIATGMGHLDRLGVKNVRKDLKTWKMTRDAINYLDIRIAEDLIEIKKYDSNWKTNKHLGNIQIQYLYSRSFFPDLSIPNETKEAYDYFLGQSKKYWLDFNVYTQGMIALANHRIDKNATVSKDITASLKERAIKHEELGWYWKGMMDGGYYWYQAPIETQALMIELFQDVANDTEAVEELKVWLLKQKQTTDWKTTKATAEACYALLLNGTDLLANDDKVDVTVGKYRIDYSGVESSDEYVKTVKADAGTGYFKTSWNGAEVTPDMGTVKVSKKEDGVAWGAVYWQYFENLDKITPHETPLKLKKKLFIQKNTDRGLILDPVASTNKLKIGDKLIVRIELRVDRNMEYVHMKDMRASGFEPLNVISRYKWQDGLGYYESTKDASTNFFFDYLPRGTYVFEYPLRVSQAGSFSNGITSIQCMYAPEFGSHSEGIRVDVVK